MQSLKERYVDIGAQSIYTLLITPRLITPLVILLEYLKILICTMVYRIYSLS